MSQYPMTPAMVQAASLMEQQRFAEAASAWETIARNDPQNAPMASMQTGAAHFFLQQFERAVEWYAFAGSLGFDANEVAEHIEEARQAAARPTPGPADQLALHQGQLFVNVGGQGWQPCTHPRPGMTVMTSEGGLFVLGGDGCWHSNDPQSATTPAPGPGARVLLIATGSYMVVQPDGSWAAS